MCWRQLTELGIPFVPYGPTPGPGHRISSPAPGDIRQSPLRKLWEGDMDASQQTSCLKRQRKLSKYKDLAALRTLRLRCITLSWKSVLPGPGIIFLSGEQLSPTRHMQGRWKVHNMVYSGIIYSKEVLSTLSSSIRSLYPGLDGKTGICHLEMHIKPRLKLQLGLYPILWHIKDGKGGTDGLFTNPRSPCQRAVPEVIKKAAKMKA